MAIGETTVRTIVWDKAQTAPRLVVGQEPSAAITWTHVVAGDRAAATQMLAEDFGFHELEIEDALTEGERPHLHEGSDHLFFTVPAVCIREEKLYFQEIGIYLTKTKLVTVSVESCDLLETILQRMPGRTLNGGRTASRIAHGIIDAIVDDYYPVLDLLEERAEDLEADVFVGRPVAIKDLLRIKRRLLELRRRLTPFRDILNGLLRHDVPVIPRADHPYFQDVYDHVLRVLERADLNRDILASVLDANLATVSNRLNQVMKVMTALATILMSVTLVASIYGMNFKFMPELGSPWGYPLALGAMVLVAGVEFVIFRKKGWF